MNDGVHRIRRATADDVPGLRLLWENAKLPVGELEKRFTEFQVFDDADGVVAGAIGLRVNGRHGLVHSEVFSDIGRADALRPILWERIRTLAPNYGLTRLWTAERAEFWSQQDLETAGDEALARLPGEFGARDGYWLTLKLREEIDIDGLLAKEFSVFKKAEGERNQQMFQQGKTLKLLATAVAAVVLFVAVVGLYIVLKRQLAGAP